MRRLLALVILCGGPLAAHGAPPVVAPTRLGPAELRRDAARAGLAHAIVDAYSNWNGFFSSMVAHWSPDGTRVLFGSQRGGLPEIYLGDPARPADPPLAITRGPERAIWARYTLDGKSILFMRDYKGDENHHYWLAKSDGTGAVDLTPGEALHRDEPQLPAARPNLILYSATRTSSPNGMLFAQDLKGGAPRLIYTNPGPGWLFAASADGTRALYADYRSDSDTVLLEVEIATGQARRIYPAKGATASLPSAGYSADDRRILLTTDEGKESSLVLALDAKTGKELARYANTSPATAVPFAVASPTGDRVAIGLDAGNHGEVRILDARTLALQRNVKLPLGDVQLGAFRADGKAFSILISTPDRPADVYAVDAASGEVRPLRDDARPGLEKLAALDTRIETVKAFDGLDIPINVYLPKVSGRLPVIVMFHGGPASSSAVRWNPFARFFSSLGYAVLEPNVRGSTGFGRAFELADNREKRADWLNDLETVNAWTRKQPWCDPSRIVVWGQSYGGYTTLMALTRQAALWRAGVDLYGIADLKAFMRTTDALIRVALSVEFGDPDKDAALLDRFSPMRDVSKIVAPLFVYTGQNDPRVPRSESDAIVAALRKRKVPVEYMVALDEGHSVDRSENKVELLTRAARFLEDALAQSRQSQGSSGKP